MTIAEDQRAFLDFVRALREAGHAAWLGSTDPDAADLFAYYGLGILLNDAQSESLRDLLTWPGGTGHVWRFANRVGKTSGLDVFHLLAILRKWMPLWAPLRDDFDDWWDAPYKTLHSAPTNRLMGKAHEIGELILEHRSTLQISPVTNRRRPAVLLPLYRSGRSTAKDGSDELWIRCINGAKVDFLSTHDGAGRMESDNWQFLTWDEFIRHQPVGDVPDIIDQTILPRTSDTMAPFVLSSTSTIAGDAIYAEIEERAARNPRYWNFKTFARSSNFAASAESITRQIAMSGNAEVAQRSIGGGLGEGGSGPFPLFLLDNAFTGALPERTERSRVPSAWECFQSFDHGIGGDANVVFTVAAPWPPNPATWRRDPAQGVSLVIRRSGRSMMPAEQRAILQREYDAYGPLWVGIDATAEGGQIVYREAVDSGMRAEAYNFAERTPGRRNRITLKEWGIQSLQWMLSYGLGAPVDDEGWVKEWPMPDGPFGLLRFPASGPWMKARRQLATYQRDDAGLTQDVAMAMIIMAGKLRRYLESQNSAPMQRYSPLRPRRRLVSVSSR